MDEPVKYPVLDDGYVQLVEVLGSDLRVVDAARVSFGSGTRPTSENQDLINYLMQHAHTSPFEHCHMTFKVRCPMDVWRQWIRHRTANVNEYSTRYSIAINSAQKTLPSEWRFQSKDKKQGSAGTLAEDEGLLLSADEERLQTLAREVYDRRLEMGVAREQARKDLPLSTYTEAFWTIDLHNLFHFLSLRLDSHAQNEIREYARVLSDITKQTFPMCWHAFEEYKLKAITFSGAERDILREIYDAASKAGVDVYGILSRATGSAKKAHALANKIGA